MHNLHFIRIKANSGQEACNNVESEIIGFGNENNWRTMCGAISEDNEVYDAGDGRYRPDENELTTIEKINECVNSWMKGSLYVTIAKEKFDKGQTNLDEWDSHELWSLSKWAEHLSQAHEFKDKSFNVLEDSFFSYKYDECGVTDLEWSGEDEGKIWIVLCDMHS